MPQFQVPSPEAMKDLIAEHGGKVSYLLHDHHELLRKLGIGRHEQNRVFCALKKLRQQGQVTRQFSTVYPTKTYIARDGQVIPVRRVTYTLN